MKVCAGLSLRSTVLTVVPLAALFVFERAKKMAPFQRGAFVADMQALLYGEPVVRVLECLVGFVGGSNC